VTYSSSVPAAITALLAAFTASASLGAAVPPVQVRDGPQLRADSAAEGVAVGYSSGQNSAVVTGTATPEGLGAGPDRERYAITCTAEVIDGSGSIAAARTRAYQLHAACGAAIAADHTLGGTVLRAVPGMGSLTQQQTTRGALARVVFPVTVDAYTTR
jgi:hypothetical protein